VRCLFWIGHKQPIGRQFLWSDRSNV
jgi:hypothetical protein